jgi:alkylation response protein AidB-like acyl-CoA dehydrogenase
MFSFQLSADQQEFRDTVRDFVTREVKPVANHPDRLQAEDMHFVPAILEQASQMGLRTIALSEALGGAGADTLTACVVAEELAAGDIGFAATLARTSELGHVLFDQAMNDAQRKQFLDKFVSDDNFHLAYAGCDRECDDGGWNYYRADKSNVEIPVVATKQGSDLVLNGSYKFVANAPLAKLIAVQVTTDAKAAGLSSAAIVLVPAGTAGMSVKEPGKVETDANGEDTYRWFHGTGGAVTFKDCKVPAANVLAGRTQLFGADAAAGRGSPLEQALNVGLGRAAYESAIDYAKIRVQGGRPIIEHQAVGNILAEIAIRLETSRNLVWKAAYAADHAGEYASISELPLQIMAKAYVSHAVHEAALLAAECFGAMGVMKDMPQPHYVHNALVFVHSDTSNSTAKLRVAEAIAEFKRG